MAISIPDRVVVFDYGEVISRSPSDADKAVLVEIAGCPPEPFWQAYWAHRDGLDDLIQKGRDLEKVVLARAVRWHLDHRILVYDGKTVVFD